MMVDGLLPDTVSPLFAVLLVVASFGTSALTAALGLGGGLLMLALMAYGMPVSALIPVHGAVQLGSNAGRLLVQREHVAWGFLTAFGAGGVIGAAVGASIAVTLPEAWLTLALGLFVLLVTWVRMPRLGTLAWPGIAGAGLVTTFLSMFVGATGPLNVAIFSASFDRRQVLVATLAAMMSAQHFMKVAAFTRAGFDFLDWLPLIAAIVATGFAGTIFGTRLLARMPEEIFRKAMKVLLTVLAADLVRRGLFALA